MGFEDGSRTEVRANGGTAGQHGFPPAIWEAELVGKKLVQAFVTLDRLPRFRGPKEPGGHWPRTITEWADQRHRPNLKKANAKRVRKFLIV
jgi:hypothetical protein